MKARLATTAALVLAAAICGADAADAARAVYRRPFGRVASMDPIRAGDVLAAEAVSLVYEPLLEVDYAARPYRLKGCVCEMPDVSADGLAYTFRIVDEDDPTTHQMHTEFYTVPQSTVDAIERTKAAGGRVIAVGTTSVRSLESAWDPQLERVTAREHETTQLYLLPGSEFHVIDALITNFHVPRSTLLMLVSAFSTRENVMAAYEHAVRERYRFFSFGDAMLIR